MLGGAELVRNMQIPRRAVDRMRVATARQSGGRLVCPGPKCSVRMDLVLSYFKVLSKLTLLGSIAGCCDLEPYSVTFVSAITLIWETDRTTQRSVRRIMFSIRPNTIPK
jgi:hypothetical protein